MANLAKSTRIPGLDGIRALAIAMVIVCHVSSTVPFAGLHWLKPLADAGIEGVTVFFFLSGYLITWLLLREEGEHGRFSLLDFYFRRAVRILPASFAFLIVLGVIAQWTGWPVSVRELLGSGFFLRNVTDGSDHTGHYWTLASEEQFYLIWPALLQWLPRRWRIPVLAGLVCAAPVLRFVLSVIGDPGSINWWRPFRANAMLAGALLALLRNANLIRICWPAPLLGLATMAFVGALLVPPGSAAILRLGAYVAELLAVGLALSILVEGHCPAAQAILAARPVVYLGQQLFCLRITGGRHEEFPLNVLLACAAAIASHHLIELPCLRHREQWRKWLRPGGNPKPAAG